MSAIRRPRVKVQANLGNKRIKEEKKPLIKEEEKDTFKCPLSTITPSNTNKNNNTDIPSNNILQKDLQSSSFTNGSPIPPSPTSRRRRTSSSSSSSTAEDHHHHIDLKQAVHNKIKSDLHLHLPPRVRTESSSSSHSLRDARIRTESVSSNLSENGMKKSKLIRDVSNKERSELTMFDLIYNFIPTANPMVKNEANNIKPASPLKTEPSNPPPTSEVPDEGDEDEDANEAPILVPQLKIGLNGEVIIDEQSLEIQTTAEKKAKKVLSNSSCIFMDEFTGSNGFYRKQKRTKEWPESETIKFYKCLHTVGTDFSLMMSLFPNRSRRDLKLKFKKEERVNEKLIKKALLHPKFFDIKELEKVLALDEEQKRKQEEEWNRIKKKKSVVKKPKTARKYSSKVSKILSGNELAYKNENILSSNIRKREIRSPVVEDEPMDQFDAVEDETTQTSVMEVDVSDLKVEVATNVKQETVERESVPSVQKESAEVNTEGVLSNELSVGMKKEQEQEPLQKEIGDYVPVEEETMSNVIMDFEVEENAIDCLSMKQECFRKFEEYDSDEDETQSGIFLQGGIFCIKNENSQICIPPKADLTEEGNEESIPSDDFPASAQNVFDGTNMEDFNYDDLTVDEIVASVTNGSLAVVTSENEEGETLYEVYKMCPDSGELSENPLNLHPEIINIIKMVV